MSKENISLNFCLLKNDMKIKLLAKCKVTKLKLFTKSNFNLENLAVLIRIL